MRHPVELRDRAVLMVGEIRADHESGRAGTTTVAKVHADNDGVLGVRKVWLRLNREREADAGPTARRTVERPRDELGQAVAARGKPRALPSTTRPRRAHTQTLSWKSLNIDTAVGAVVGAATGALGKVAGPGCPQQAPRSPTPPEPPRPEPHPQHVKPLPPWPAQPATPHAPHYAQTPAPQTANSDLALCLWGRLAIRPRRRC